MANRKASASWTSIERPSHTEVEKIIKDFDLDQGVVVDALDPHEVPRLEIDGSTTYFISRLPDTDDDFNDFTTPVLLVLKKDQIITLSRESLTRLWQPFKERTYSETDTHIETFAKMLEAIIHEYFRKVSAINRQMRALSTDITKLHPRDIAVFVEHERKLNDYVDALLPMNDAIESFIKRNAATVTEEEGDLLEKVSIDFEQIIARSKSLLRTITNVRDSFRAVMDTRLNETMRVLTVITLALTVPTMLAGLYGMNVHLPGQETLPMFWIIAGFSIAISFALVFYFLIRRR